MKLPAMIRLAALFVYDLQGILSTTVAITVHVSGDRQLRSGRRSVYEEL